MIIRSRAPLRLGLAGGGTDVSPYCDEYGGAVLNVTINMYAHCTIEPTDNGMIEFHAADRDEHFCAPSCMHLPLEGELQLHKGVYNRIMQKFRAGKKPLSFRMTTYSDVPAGSGLGSSSTMVVAMIKAFMEWLNLPLGEYDIASMAYDIERNDVGLAGGKQDQYAATFGGFNFIEFKEDNHVLVNPLRVKRWISTELESELVLYYTGTSRDSAKIIDEQVRNTKEKKEAGVEHMHAVKEVAYRMKEHVLTGNFRGVSDSLREGWEAKKRLAKVISNSAIDDIYEYALANGARAAKISGAGGGGFMMIMCDAKLRHTLLQALRKLPGEVTLPSFTERGCEAWTIYENE